MALSHDVVSQFAKMVNKPEENKEETVKGTFKMINGQEYVQLDGSNIYTPVTSTVEAEDGDRVNVLIKDHAALLTSNITSPSARNKDVTALRSEVDEQGNVIQQMDNSIIQQGNSIIQINNTVNQQNDVINSHSNLIDRQNNIIQQHDNVIQQQGNDITSLNNNVTLQGNIITELNNTIESQNNTIIAHDNRITTTENNITLQGNTIAMHGSTLETFNSDIRILNSAFIIHDGVMEGLAQIIVNDLKTNHLNTVYANIDFSNIQMAAVTKLFTDSGIIKDLIVQQGKITGELVGVTIKGDLIEANTLQADKLVILGEDGLYYKLNIDGLNNISTDQASKFTLTTSQPDNWSTNYEDYYIINNSNYIHVSGQTAPNWSANTYYKLNSTYESGLDGTNILAHSITADRIQVTDLVAFGATIGGYHIGQHSLYSGSKSSINNTTSGIFLSDDGQMAIGNNDSFVKFYKDQNNDYKLDLSANNIKFTSSNKTIREEMDDIHTESTTAISNSVHQGTTPPDNTNKLWLDTNSGINKIKKYLPDPNGETYSWQIINDYSALSGAWTQWQNQWSNERNLIISEAQNLPQSVVNQIITSAQNATLKQLSNKIIMEFVDKQTIQQWADEKISLVTKERNKYIRFGEEGIELGEESSPFLLKIKNGDITNNVPPSIEIIKDNILVSEWMERTFTAPEVHIKENGWNYKFAFVPHSNGSLGFRKVVD